MDHFHGLFILMDPNLASSKGITERNDKNNTKEYDHPSNTPDARFQAVSKKSHVTLEGMQRGFSNYGLVSENEI